MLIEGLLCWFALLATAVAADLHSSYALLATLPAVLFGLSLFLLHWLLPGISSANPTLRRARRSAAPALFALLAFGICRQALKRGEPENQFRAVTGIPLPAGISNLHTKLWFGPVGGGGTVYFEGSPSVVDQLIANRRLERDLSVFHSQAYLERVIPAGFPRPAHSNWTLHRAPDGSGRDGHLLVFRSTSSAGVYVFTGY